MSLDAPPKGKLFPCAACGAKIEFDPASRSLKCPYCGHATTIADPADDAEVVERDFEEYLDKLEHGEGTPIAGHSSQVRCTGCGAMVLLDDKVVTEKCPFCGTHLENKPESAAGMIAPESLVPFKHDFRHARDKFTQWIGSLWFAPTELKHAANLGQLNGVYVPYWTYDALTNTRYHGERGDNYQVTEQYTVKDANGNNVVQTRTVTHTRWTSVSGEVQHFFDDVLICGTKSVPEHLIGSLAPWDLDKLEPFNPDFLGGFKTERYGIGLKEGFGEAKAVMEPKIVQLIRRDIGGDHQRISGKRTHYLGITFKHLLLPAWVANYRYHDKLYQILVNGRTGKISGERPWSAWKIARLVILILLAVILFGFVASRAKGAEPATSVRIAEEFTSGPQVGATVPGQFFTEPLNGPDAGVETCLYCKYGHAPVVMIFAPKPSEELARLVKALEPVAAKAEKDCGICVIVTDSGRDSRRELGKLADDANLKRIVVATVDPDRVKEYELNAAAGVTALLYDRRTVRANSAFKPGTLNEAAVAKLVNDARKHLGVVADAAPARDFSLERYELGRRLKTFEARWEKVENATARKRAAAKLVDAHSLFLTLRFPEAARVLDSATFALDSNDTPGAARLWVNSLMAVPKERLVDGAAKELAVTLRPLYMPGGEPPKNLEVQLWFNDKQVVKLKPDRIPFDATVPLPPLGESPGLDRTLYCLIEAGRVQRHYTIGVSQVKNRDARLAALKEATDAWSKLETIEQATARDRAVQLHSLITNTEETDVPAASLLAHAEAMSDGKPFFSFAKPGEYWMSVPRGGRLTSPVRVFIPRGLAEGKPVPVVVGMHGAGGTENLFFEGYGAGIAVAECRKRGWVFIATRSGLDFTGGPPVPAILDELGKRFPLDPKRTFLVGHSMGAGQVARLAEKHEGRFAAIACLGGGGAVRNTEPFATLPVFVAAGEKDFGLAPAKALHKALAAGGAKRATYKEYPDVEHLLIVREAIPDVFTQFDTAAKP